MESLTADETTQLADCEDIVGRGLYEFVAVGCALRSIRDGRLYRQTHKKFEDYCRFRWDLDRRRPYQLIEAARVVENVKIFSHSISEEQLPRNEAQARALAQVPEDRQAEVWRKALDSANGRKVTARLVTQVAEEYVRKKADTKRKSKKNSKDFARALHSAISAVERLGQTLDAADDRRSRVQQMLEQLKKMEPPAQEKQKKSKA